MSRAVGSMTAGGVGQAVVGDPSTRDALTLSQKLAYGCGDLASNLAWGMMLSFLMYYYTDIYVIPAAVVAWLLLVPRVLDALCDPAVGYLVDRTGGRFVRPIMGLLAVPFGLTTFLCFLPVALSPGAKIVWACATYILLGLVYSAINTPYGVMSNMMAETTPERVSLNAFRMGGCQSGQLIISGVTLPAIAWLGGGTSLAAQRTGMTLLAATIGVVSACLWLATWRKCRVRRPLPTEQHSLRVLLQTLATNRRWHLSNAISFLNFMVFSAEGGLAIHYTRFTLHRPIADAALLLTCSTIAALAGAMLSPVFTARLGVRRTFMASFLGEGLALALMPLAGSSFPIVLLLVALQFLAQGPVSALSYVLLAEAVDESRAKTGIAAAGLAFSFNSLVGKVAAGFAGFATASFLASAHYSPTAVVTDDGALRSWISLGFVGLPLCCVALSFVIMLLSRKDGVRFAPAVVRSQAGASRPSRKAR